MAKVTAVFESSKTDQVYIQSEDHHMVTSKTISFEDFKYIINECVHLDPVTRIGRVPETFLDGLRAQNDSLTGTFLFYIPSGIQKMSYINENDSMMIPFPNLIFHFECNNGNVTTKNVYATPEKKERLTDNSKLYYYPFGNVSSSGAICYGQNEIPKMETLFSFEYLIAVFLQSTTNNDLYSDMYTTMMLPLCQLIQEVAKMETFNHAILVPNGRKLGDLLH